MKTRNIVALAALTFALPVGASAQGMATASNAAVRVVAPSMDIVETAVAAGSFKTLAAALQAAGLVDALKGKGPFTVFARTDEAFAKLPAGTVDAVLKHKAKLTAILTYHVVAGEVPASEVVKLTSAKTLNGAEVKISTMDGKVMVNNAHVVKTDVKATNGIIHVNIVLAKSSRLRSS